MQGSDIESAGPAKTDEADSVADLYDPLAVDAYADHLAEVNNHRPVLASQDIYNAKGVLLVKQGTPISADVTQRIVNFKLRQPLESAVSIANEIDGKQLHRDLGQILRSDPELDKLVHREGLSLLVQNQCNHYQQYPSLCQKLTVLADRMPDIYQRSLTCALICLLIARQMRLSETDLDALFLAALVHDIGMLHIDPELIMRDGPLTPEEWRRVQAHTIIGQKLLRVEPNMPEGVSRAILEHHERCDGSGYPMAKQGEELSQLGQIIYLADSVVAVYHNRLHRRGEKWRDLIPMLLMNGQDHFYCHYTALIRVLHGSDAGECPQPEVSEVKALSEDLLKRIELFRQCYGALGEALPEAKSSRQARAINSVYAHVALAVRGSGLLEESYARWLQHVQDQALVDAGVELRELGLMLEELAFHLYRLCRMVKLYQAPEESPMARVQAHAESWLEQLAQLVNRARVPERESIKVG